MINRRLFVQSNALAAGSAALPDTASAPKPKRALMKLGATVMGGSFREGGRGPFAGGPPAGEEGRGRRASAGPRDPEQGFKPMGRFGIKNVAATAQIAGGRLYVTVDILNPPFLPSSHIDRKRHPATSNRSRQ